MTAVKSKKTGRQVVDYNMSMHCGVCLGPVDALVEIRVKDKIAWPPSRAGAEEDEDDIDFVLPRIPGLMQALNSPEEVMPTPWGERDDIACGPAILKIHEPELFGGDQHAGGVSGLVAWLPGHADQVIPSDMAARFGLPPEGAPGFRGVASLFFYGGTIPEKKKPKPGIIAAASAAIQAVSGRGFLWGQNDPRLPPMSFKMIRRPRAFALARELPPNVSEDERQVLMIGEDEGYLPQANPAAMLYEVLTSRMLGIAMPEDRVDLHSFIRAARVLSREKLGITLTWDTKTTGRAFAGKICDHIGGGLYLDPDSGKWGVRLLRSDAELRLYRSVGGGKIPDSGEYGPDATDCYRPDITITPDNADLVELRRQTWGDTVNAMVAKWTSTLKGQSKSVSVQNDAGISIRGGLVSGELRLDGLRKESVAVSVAKRELKTRSKPVAAADFIIGREGLKLKPFDVVTVRWPEEDLVMRARLFPIDYGKLSDQRVRVTAVDDVFSDAQVGVQVSEAMSSSRWRRESPPSRIFPTFYTPAPFGVIAAAGTEISDIVSLDDTGEAVPLFFAGSPDRMERMAIAKGVGTGYLDYEEAGTVETTPSGRMMVALPAEAISTIDITGIDFGINAPDFSAGDYLLVSRTAHLRSQLVNEPAGQNGPGLRYDAQTGAPVHLYSGFGHMRAKAPEALELHGEIILPDGTAPSWHEAGRRREFTNAMASAASVVFDGGAGWRVGSDRNGVDYVYPEEWMRIVSIDGQTVTVSRGAYDTTPAPISVDDRVYYIERGALPAPLGLIDSTADPAFAQNFGGVRIIQRPENANGKAVAWFGAGVAVCGYRTQRPIRPAGVRMDVAGGSPLGPGSVRFGKVVLLSEPSGVSVTFKSRNRRYEDAAAAAWDDDAIAPEGGQVNFIRVWRRVHVTTPPELATGSVRTPYTEMELLHEEEAISGGFALQGTLFGVRLDKPGSDRDDITAYLLEVGSRLYEMDMVNGVAVRSDRIAAESQQNHMLGIEVRNPTGYGQDYGMYYGGSASL